MSICARHSCRETNEYVTVLQAVFPGDIKAQQKDVNCLHAGGKRAALKPDEPTSAPWLFREHAPVTTGTIEKATTSHWKQFLDETSEGKLWEGSNVQETTSLLRLHPRP